MEFELYATLMAVLRSGWELADIASRRDLPHDSLIADQLRQHNELVRYAQQCLKGLPKETRTDLEAQSGRKWAFDLSRELELLTRRTNGLKLTWTGAYIQQINQWGGLRYDRHLDAVLAAIAELSPMLDPAAIDVKYVDQRIHFRGLKTEKLPDNMARLAELLVDAGPAGVSKDEAYDAVYRKTADDGKPSVQSVSDGALYQVALGLDNKMANLGLQIEKKSGTWRLCTTTTDSLPKKKSPKTKKKSSKAKEKP